MSENKVEKPLEETTHSSKISAEQIDSIPVTLVFEIGELIIPLRELNTIQPGTAFDLQRSAARPAIIRANGKIIGYGELLQIDDRIGVRILELTGNDDDG